jgi:hypothetical protein
MIYIAWNLRQESFKVFKKQLQRFAATQKVILSSQAKSPLPKCLPLIYSCIAFPIWLHNLMQSMQFATKSRLKTFLGRSYGNFRQLGRNFLPIVILLVYNYATAWRPR